MSLSIDSHARAAAIAVESEMLLANRHVMMFSVALADVGVGFDICVEFDSDHDALESTAAAGAISEVSLPETGPARQTQHRRRLRNRRLQSTQRSASRVLYEDKRALLCRLERHPLALELASEELRKDYDVATRAVSLNGLALQFVSPGFLNCRELVLQGLRASGGAAMKFANLELREDKPFMLEAVSISGYALRHACPELADDEEVVLAAISQTKLAWQFASSRLQHNALFRHGHKLSEMECVSVTVAGATAAGHSLRTIKRAGYSALAVRDAGYALSEMRAAGYALRDFDGQGPFAAEARAGGYSLAEMQRAGYGALAVEAAGYDSSEMQRAGFDLRPWHIAAATGVKPRHG